MNVLDYCFQAIVVQLFNFFRWYDKHLELCSYENDAINRVSVILLTNDKLNQQNAQLEGIEAYTGKLYELYIELYVNKSTLMFRLV